MSSQTFIINIVIYIYTSCSLFLRKLSWSKVEFNGYFKVAGIQKNRKLKGNSSAFSQIKRDKKKLLRIKTKILFAKSMIIVETRKNNWAAETVKNVNYHVFRSIRIALCDICTYKCLIIHLHRKAWDNAIRLSISLLLRSWRSRKILFFTSILLFSVIFIELNAVLKSFTSLNWLLQWKFYLISESVRTDSWWF